MGQVHDFFRPVANLTVCQMLQSGYRHEFYNGTDWVVPAYTHQLGGSAVNWPSSNVHGDQGRHLSAWGRTLPENVTGGCCSTTCSDSFQGWGKSFVINAIVATTPSPTGSPTPCADVHTDPSFVDELPAPICVDVLAQDECEIPAIRARCNFTCTGCTAGPTAPPTHAPTSHQAAVPYVPRSATVTEIYSNDGTVLVTESVIQGVCAQLPPSTTMIEVVMGQVHDFFRPIAGRTVCEMVLSSNFHEFYNGTDWTTPSYSGCHFGGSASDSFSASNVTGDARRYLSVWGGVSPGIYSPNSWIGGCCSTSYAVHFQGWGQPFTMNAIVATPSPTTSPTPCTDTKVDPTFVDELPVPICADVLAHDECKIPEIRVRCNFTCTGCTTAPTVQTTQGPTTTVTSTDPSYSSSTEGSADEGSGVKTIIIIVLTVSLVSLLLLFVHKERSKAKSRRTSNNGSQRGLPAVPKAAFANNVLVPQDDNGYVAGSNQVYAEPTPVYQEPTPVVESHA